MDNLYTFTRAYFDLFIPTATEEARNRMATNIYRLLDSTEYRYSPYFVFELIEGDDPYLSGKSEETGRLLRYLIADEEVDEYIAALPSVGSPVFIAADRYISLPLNEVGKVEGFIKTEEGGMPTLLVRVSGPSAVDGGEPITLPFPLEEIIPLG